MQTLTIHKVKNLVTGKSDFIYEFKNLNFLVLPKSQTHDTTDLSILLGAMTNQQFKNCEKNIHEMIV